MRLNWALLMAAAYCTDVLAQPAPDQSSISWAAVAIAMITALPPTIVALGALLVSWRSGDNAARAAKNASVKASEVSESLRVSTSATDAKLTDLKTVARDTHTLVNSNMEKVLLSLAVALRTVARSDPTPENIAAAENAEKELSAHRSKQKIVDEAVENDPKSTIIQRQGAAADGGSIGEVVGEVRVDVKEIKQDVKDLKNE